MERTWGELGVNLHQLGPNLGQLGANLGQLGANLDQLGANLSQLGAIFGQCGTNVFDFGPSWDPKTSKILDKTIGFLTFLVFQLEPQGEAI